MVPELVRNGPGHPSSKESMVSVVGSKSAFWYVLQKMRWIFCDLTRQKLKKLKTQIYMDFF